MKVWITKYALTAGILVKTIDRDARPGALIAVGTGGALKSYFRRNEWHASEKDALAWAEVMRARKIESLRRQIEKLEKMAIKVKQ